MSSLDPIVTPDPHHPLLARLRPVPGWSFKVGERSFADLADECAFEVRDRDTQRRVELTHPSGLQVRVECTGRLSHRAVEYRLTLANVGTTTLPPISEWYALDLTFALGDDDLTIHGCTGGTTQHHFPPFAWTTFTTHGGGAIHRAVLTTDGGRSSNRDLPFFLVADPEDRGGIFVAIGWSGQWRVDAAAGEGGLARLTGGVPEVHLVLGPGECITGPTVLVGAYQGDRIEGGNALRRYLRTYMQPSLEGVPSAPDGKPLPPTSYNTWFGLNLNIAEENLRAAIDAAAEVGLEYFSLDAGWYADSGLHPSTDFYTTTGNWRRVDARKYPRGLKPIAEYVRSKGMKLGLWFDLERCWTGSDLMREHPEWCVPWPRAHSDYTTSPHEPVRLAHRTFAALVNFGLKEVRDWAKETIGYYCEALDLEWIRYDNNISPLYYWSAMDAGDHQGWSQHQHIAGVYEVLDWLRSNFPRLCIEGCSSGGRRMDFEILRRCHTFWISDHTDSPHINRHHVTGGSCLLPSGYLNTNLIVRPPLSPQGDALVRSLFAGAFGVGAPLHEWSTAERERLAQHIARYKQLRGYLLGDYYPLRPQARDRFAWEGFQFHDPSRDSGFYALFRQRSPDTTTNVALRGLDPGRRYRLIDRDGDEAEHVVTGADLADGISHSLDQEDTSVLIEYRSEG